MLSSTAPTLHNLKEAPNPSGRLILLPVQTSANTGSQNIAAEAPGYTRYVLLTAPVRWTILHRAGNFPANPAPADIPAPFYVPGCGLHLPQGICCRLTANLHQNLLTQSTIPDRASLESRNAGASDAIPPRRRKPRFIWPAPSFPHTDTPFSGRCRFRKGEKDRYRGGHDAPENLLHTQAACTAYSLKLPTPQQPVTPA